MSTQQEVLAALEDRLSRGQVVVVVGSGVSAAVAPSRRGSLSWSGLLQSGLARIAPLPDIKPEWIELKQRELSLGDIDSLLTVASNVQAKLSKHSLFERWLAEQFEFVTPEKPGLVHAILELGAPVVTTNYDTLIEQAGRVDGCTWRESDRMARALRGDQKALVHLHGRWDVGETVVLSALKYEEALSEPALQALQQAVASLGSLLFVGCGGTLEDPNIGALLAWCAKTFPAMPAAQHVVLARSRDADKLRAALPPQFPVSVLEYGDSFDDLEPFIRRLALHSPTAVSVALEALREGIHVTLDEDLEVAAKSFEASRYSEALEQLNRLSADLDERMQRDRADGVLRAKHARVQLECARALGLVEGRASAIERLSLLDRSALEAEHAPRLARLLASLELFAEAANVAADLPEGQEKERTKAYVAIASGIPTDTKGDPLLVSIAMGAAPRNDRAGAGKLALELLAVTDGDPTSHLYNRFRAAQLLLAWLQASVSHLAGTDDAMPVESRVGHTRRIYGVLNEAEAFDGPLRMRVARTRAQLLWLVGTDHQFRQAAAAVGPNGVVSLPATDPWMQMVREAAVARSQGRLTEAVALLTRARAEYPEDLIVARDLVDVWAEDGRVSEALPLALEVLAGIPGPGSALRVARLLLSDGQGSAAHELLANYGGDALDLRALRSVIASQLGKFDEAIELAPAWLAVEPDDALVRFMFAVALARRGRRDEAVREAGIAIEAGLLHESPHQNFAAIRDIVTHPLPLDDRARAHLAQIARALRERFPTHPDAESERLSILAQLGFPSDLDGPDRELLARAGIQTDDEEAQLSDRVRQRRAYTRALSSWYDGGLVPVESLYGELDSSPAQMVASGALIAGPLKAYHAEATIHGRELLLGALELTFMQELGVFETTLELLGDGWLLAFDGIEDELEHWATVLPWRVRTVELELLRHAWSEIGELGKLTVSKEIVNYLAPIDRGEVGERVELSDESRIRLREGLDRLTQDERAAMLARATRDAWHAAKLGGRARTLSRVSPPSELVAFDVRDDGLVRSAINRAWSWLEALVGHPNRTLLSADYATSSWFAAGTPFELAISMRWKPEALLAARARYEHLAGRHWTLSGIIDAARAAGVLDAETGASALSRLAEHGFAEALRVEVLLPLGRRLGGDMLGSHADRKLGSLERYLSRTKHPARTFLAIAAGGAYADAIRTAFVLGEPWPARERFTASLLDRAERLDQSTAGVLEQVAVMLAVASRSMPSSAAVSSVSDDSATVFAGIGSPADMMWRAIGGWIADRTTRLRIFERAVARAFVTPANCSTVALHVAVDALPIEARGNYSAHHPAAFARLLVGSREPETGLRAGFIKVSVGEESLDFSHDALLTRAAGMTENATPIGWVVEVPFELGDATFAMRVASEPALFRASSLAKRQHLPGLIVGWSRLDGRVENALRQLKEKPEDAATLERAVRVMATSPAVFARADPGWILRWGSALEQFEAFPKDLDDLLELLGERLDAPFQPSLTDIIASELETDPARGWARLWQRALLPLTSPPAEIAATLAARGLESSEKVVEFLEALRRPQDRSSAELMQMLVYLRSRAAIGLSMNFDGTPLNLREVVREVTADVLEHAIALEPKAADEPDAIANGEVAIYRRAIRIVERWSPSTMPGRARLWVGHQLGHWIVARMREAGDSTRALGIEALNRAELGISIRSRRTDALSPFIWSLRDETCDPGSTLPIRLVSVLTGIFLGEIGGRAKEARRTDENTEAPFSPRTEAMLVELAQRPLSPIELELRARGRQPSDLGGDGLVTVPDLSLAALLTINRRHFDRLNPTARRYWLEQLDQTDWHLSSELSGIIKESLAWSAADWSDHDKMIARRVLASAPSDDQSELRLAIRLLMEGDPPSDRLVDALRPQWSEGPHSPTDLDELGWLWLAVAEVHPTRLDAMIDVLESVAGHPFDVLAALGRVASQGSEEARAAALAVVLARRDRYAPSDAYDLLRTQLSPESAAPTAPD